MKHNIHISSPEAREALWSLRYSVDSEVFQAIPVEVKNEDIIFELTSLKETQKPPFFKT